MLTAARKALLALALLAAAMILVWQFDQHTRLRDWLFWRYAGYWLLVSVWGLGLYGPGNLFWRLIRPNVDKSYDFLFSMVMGLLIFYWLMFLGGVAKLYGTAFFVALPLLMIAAGWRVWAELFERLSEQITGKRTFRFELSWLGAVVVFYGVICTFALYLATTVPRNISADGVLYHLGIAEQYVTSGGIHRFAEGWFLGAYPHLASLVYTWALLIPWGTDFDRAELAAHLEVAVFLLTLVGVQQLVRSLLQDRPVKHAWVAIFLFPGIMLYDSSLVVNAEHFLAFFAAPAGIAFFFAWRDPRAKECTLLALCLAGAAATKYSAISWIIWPAMFIGLRGCWLLVRSRGTGHRYALKGLAGFAGVGLAATIPHWAKNLWFYKNPVYPLLQSIFKASTPWPEGVEYRLQVLQNLFWRPTRDWNGVVETFKAGYNFSFTSHAWGVMHGAYPLFGSLFTLSALALPFLGWKARRVWALFALSQLGIFLWYWTGHEERYLQGHLPWMAAVVAAVLGLAWRAGAAAKGSVALLVLLQVAWGARAYFVPTHVMIGTAPIKAVADLFGSEHRGDFHTYLQPFAEGKALGESTPEGSVILMHHHDFRVGIRRTVVQDHAVTQGGVGYAPLRSPAETFHMLDGLGVTHIAWKARVTEDGVGDDIVFWDFVKNWGGATTRSGAWHVTPMPTSVPKRGDYGPVAVLSCDNDHYVTGLYRISDLSIIVQDKKPVYPKPRTRGSVDELTQEAEFLVINPKCHPKAAGSATNLASRPPYQIYRR